MPVFIVAAYDENGEPNAMNAAWGGVYTDDMIGICLSEVNMFASVNAKLEKWGSAPNPGMFFIL